jgi:hypothetical protein
MVRLATVLALLVLALVLASGRVGGDGDRWAQQPTAPAETPASICEGTRTDGGLRPAGCAPAASSVKSTTRVAPWPEDASKARARPLAT